MPCPGVTRSSAREPGGGSRVRFDRMRIPNVRTHRRPAVKRMDHDPYSVLYRIVLDSGCRAAGDRRVRPDARTHRATGRICRSTSTGIR